MEIESVMSAVKYGRTHTRSPELEGICGDMATPNGQLARCVRFALLIYEDSYQRSDVQPWLGSCTTLAQDAALGAHTLILEDGPGMPIPVMETEPEYDDSSNIDGDVLEGMYAPGYKSLKSARLTEEQARRLREQGSAGGLDRVPGTG
jgi:hypothetical protein